MLNLADLNRQIDRLAERLRVSRRTREERLSLALDMLADVEERVKAQRAALDQANARVAELEKDREALHARISEIVKLYDSSLNENEALFKRVERLSSKVAAETGPARKAEGSAVLPVAEGSVVVQGPSNTLFLKDLDTEPASARDRFKDNEAIRRLYNHYQRRDGSQGGIS